MIQLALFLACTAVVIKVGYVAIDLFAAGRQS